MATQNQIIFPLTTDFDSLVTNENSTGTPGTNDFDTSIEEQLKNSHIHVVTIDKDAHKLPWAGTTMKYSPKDIRYANTWSRAEAETFQLRVGPNYDKTKAKAKAAPDSEFYDVVGIDFFQSPKRIDNIATKVRFPEAWIAPFLMPPNSNNDRISLSEKDRNVLLLNKYIPPFYVLNVQIPSNFSTPFFSLTEVTDGSGWSLVIYFRLKPAINQLLIDTPSLDGTTTCTIPTALRLLALYCMETCPPPPPPDATATGGGNHDTAAVASIIPVGSVDKSAHSSSIKVDVNNNNINRGDSMNNNTSNNLDANNSTNILGSAAAAAANNKGLLPPTHQQKQPHHHHHAYTKEGRLKVICRINNIEQFGLPAFITAYNAKPTLIRHTGTLTRGLLYFHKDNETVVEEKDGDHRGSSISSSSAVPSSCSVGYFSATPPAAPSVTTSDKINSLNDPTSSSSSSSCLSSFSTIPLPVVPYLEMDINVHRFGSLPKKGLETLFSRFPKMSLSVGLCLESRSNEEMPEMLFGCVDLNQPSTEGCAWPYVATTDATSTTPAV